jgi:hypothetical protein
MRLLLPVAMIITSSASAQPSIIIPPTAHQENPLQQADCPNPSSQFARDGSIWREKPIKPQKLSELPPAETYAAVYHLDGRGCMVPIKYRDIRR